MPRIYVQLGVFRDDGSMIWSYLHEEMVPPTNDAQENALRLAGAILGRGREGLESISAQAAVEAPLLAVEQEEAEQELGRCPECGHSTLFHLDGGAGAPVPCRFRVPERGGQECGCEAAL